MPIQMGGGDSDDDDLQALRLAALQSLKNKESKVSENVPSVAISPSLPFQLQQPALQWSPVGGRKSSPRIFNFGIRGRGRKQMFVARGYGTSRGGGITYGNWPNQVVNRSNLISIVPTGAEDCTPAPSYQQNLPLSGFPQQLDNNNDNIPKQDPFLEKSTVPSKFSRYEHSDSEESEEDDEARGEGVEEEKIADGERKSESDSEGDSDGNQGDSETEGTDSKPGDEEADEDVILMQDEDSLGKLLDEFEQELDSENKPKTKENKHTKTKVKASVPEKSKKNTKKHSQETHKSSVPTVSKPRKSSASPQWDRKSVSPEKGKVSPKTCKQFSPRHSLSPVPPHRSPSPHCHRSPPKHTAPLRSVSPERRWFRQFSPSRRSPPNRHFPSGNRTPLRYFTRSRSRSPTRRHLSPARRLSPGRRSPPLRYMSPGRRSPRHLSPGRRSPPLRHLSPGRRSPLPRHMSPGRRSPLLRHLSPSRRSPPPRHLSPSRRSPLPKHLSPSRRSPPARHLSPGIRSQPPRHSSPERRSPLRRASPGRRSPFSRQLSPRRRSPLPRKVSPHSRHMSPNRRSPPLRHLPVSPGHRSPLPFYKKRSLSPVAHFSPSKKGSVSPTRRHVTGIKTLKRNMSPHDDTFKGSLSTVPFSPKRSRITESPLSPGRNKHSVSRSSSSCLSLSPSPPPRAREQEYRRHTAPLTVLKSEQRNFFVKETSQVTAKKSKQDPVKKSKKSSKSKNKKESKESSANTIPKVDDVKLEARRRKFESSQPICIESNKKIRLKNVKREGRGPIAMDTTLDEETSSNDAMKVSKHGSAEPEDNRHPGVEKEESIEEDNSESPDQDAEGSEKGDDLRAELKRRRAERLHKAGNVHHILPTRLVQSALHGAVGKAAVLQRKEKASSKESTKRIDTKSGRAESRRVMVIPKPEETQTAACGSAVEKSPSEQSATLGDKLTSSPKLHTFSKDASCLEQTKGPVHSRLGTSAAALARSHRHKSKSSKSRDRGDESGHSSSKARKFRLKRSKLDKSAPDLVKVMLAHFKFRVLLSPNTGNNVYFAFISRVVYYFIGFQIYKYTYKIKILQTRESFLLLTPRKSF